MLDDDDYEWLWRMGCWCFVSEGYAVKGARQADPWPTGKTMYMHRVILEHHGLLEGGKEVDHIDGNPLNNQKSNLRVVTQQQNNWNQHKVTGTSQYKGVCWDKRAKKWMAYVSLDRKQKHLGYFTDEKEAAKAYDEAAKEHFGEYAKLNFPHDKEV